jgi:hypothetical protein
MNYGKRIGVKSSLLTFEHSLGRLTQPRHLGEKWGSVNRPDPNLPVLTSSFFAMDVITFLSCTLTDGIQREWRAIQTGKRAPAIASVRSEAFPAQFRRARASDRPGRREFPALTPSCDPENKL